MIGCTIFNSMTRKEANLDLKSLNEDNDAQPIRNPPIPPHELNRCVFTEETIDGCFCCKPVISSGVFYSDTVPIEQADQGNRTCRRGSPTTPQPILHTLIPCHHHL